MAVVYFLIAVFQLFLLANASRLLVNTTGGEVLGVHRELDGQPYRVFTGIPYAEPPVGALRFSNPVAKIPWEGVFNATSFGRSCPQTIPRVWDFSPDYVVQIPTEALEIDEDCLTLNVYTPATPANYSTDCGWAVMVWLHGGSYQHGQGSGYDAAALALKGDIVVVTINFRLGPLGFLYTGDESASGNFGLKDQQVALRWVQNNIQAFCGDPARVTLFGQADIYESATLHLLARDSRPLFHRVAAHSTVWQNLNPSATSSEWSTKEFARLAMCPTEDSDMMVECLRDKTVQEILEYNLLLSEKMQSSFVWRPLFNRDFFVQNPMDNLKHDLLMLFNSGDGSIALELLKDLFLEEGGMPPDFTGGITTAQWNKWLRTFINSSKVSDLAIGNQYIDSNTMNENFARLKALVNMHLDWNIFRNNYANLDDLKPILSSIYMMIFDHRSSANDAYPELGLVPHGEELSYIFGLPFNASGIGERFTDEERALSHQMITYWSNFAKTGDPNKNENESLLANVSLPRWPEFGESETYVQIQLAGDVQIGQRYHGNEVYFWNEYLPEINEVAKDSCWVVPTRAPAPSPTGTPQDCDTLVIGGNLGFSLTPAEADSLIGTLMFVLIALLCVIILVSAAAAGFKFKSQAVSVMSKDNAESGTSQNQNGGITKGSPHYENVPFTSVSIISKDYPSTSTESEGEAGPMPEKPRFPDDGISADEDFPPPPDAWARVPSQSTAYVEEPAHGEARESDPEAEASENANLTSEHEGEPAGEESLESENPEPENADNERGGESPQSDPATEPEENPIPKYEAEPKEEGATMRIPAEYGSL